jgi:hypothetical protein
VDPQHIYVDLISVRKGAVLSEDKSVCTLSLYSGPKVAATLSAVKQLKLDALSSDSINVSWQQQSGGVSNLVYFRYEKEKRSTENKVPDNDCSFTITNLKADALYFIYVVTIGHGERRIASKIYNCRTLKQGATSTQSSQQFHKTIVTTIEKAPGIQQNVIVAPQRTTVTHITPKAQVMAQVVPTEQPAPQVAPAAPVVHHSSVVSPQVTSQQAPPVHTMPQKAPAQAVPQKAPVQTVPQKAPLQTVPQKAPVQAVPQKAPVQTVPQKAPLQTVPQKAPLQSVPQLAPQKTPVQPKMSMLQQAPVEAPLVNNVQRSTAQQKRPITPQMRPSHQKVSLTSGQKRTITPTGQREARDPNLLLPDKSAILASRGRGRTLMKTGEKKRSHTPQKMSMIPRDTPDIPERPAAPPLHDFMSPPPMERSNTPQKRSNTPQRRSVTPQQRRSMTPQGRSMTPSRRGAPQRFSLMDTPAQNTRQDFQTSTETKTTVIRYKTLQNGKEIQLDKVVYDGILSETKMQQLTAGCDRIEVSKLQHGQKEHRTDSNVNRKDFIGQVRRDWS